VNKVIKKIGNTHAKVFGYVTKKAKKSKWWAIVLTALVLYEIIEHTVYPILVPWLAYQQWFVN